METLPVSINFTITISIIALVVSVISLIISAKKLKIAKNTYWLNIKPALSCDTSIDNTKKEYSLRIRNTGANPVFDVEIKQLDRLFDTEKGEVIAATSTEKASQHINKLAPNKEQIISIDRKDLENTLNMKKAVSAITPHDLIPINLYYITYRRKPDLSVYNIKKYFFVFESAAKEPNQVGGLIVIDADKGQFDQFIKLRQFMEIYDSERL